MAKAQREGDEMRSQDISLLVFGFGKHASNNHNSSLAALRIG
jgi:hypothetical protein